MQKNKTGFSILVGLLIVILFVVVGLMESNPIIEEVPTEQVVPEESHFIYEGDSLEIIIPENFEVSLEN